MTSLTNMQIGYIDQHIQEVKTAKFVKSLKLE
jgi:hypothetical protein